MDLLKNFRNHQQAVLLLIIKTVLLIVIKYYTSDLYISISFPKLFHVIQFLF